MPPFGKRKRKKNNNSNPPLKLSVKMSSECSTKSLDSSKSNSSVMKRQIVTTTVGDKTEYTIITTMKNESSRLNNALKFTDDSNKIMEEKQTQIQNVLTFPGHSFILVLSEKIEEDTKAYNCVLCYQNSYRTDLEGMIQHGKSKEHLLKVMELVNLKDADLSSQNGTSDEIVAVLKGRTSDLDKDGVSFAMPSTFLSIQKKIYKRIVSLRKEKAKIKLSADIGANKEAGMKDPKVTTSGVNSAEKEKPQIGKFSQNPGDSSQGQKQALKRLHPGSKTLSKTAVNITSAKFESNKLSEIENGNRKIEKIDWNEDKNTTSKSSAMRKRKRKQKIVEVDCEEDKVIAATSEAEKSSQTKKSKKIVLNEENFKVEDSDDGILDLKNLNKSEREVYETYKKELNELVELSRNRRPNKIIIVTDKRDVFTEDEINTKYHLYRIIKDENLTFSNIKQHLVQDPEFGSGVLYVILCGINSINREKINPACLNAQCTFPFKFLDKTNCEIDLIRKALYIHKMILKFNKEDTAIFSGLIPSLPNIFNKFSYKKKKRKCSRIHKADLPPQCIEEYDINKLYLYNSFTKLHSKLLGFTPLNLERGFFVQNNNSDNRIVTFNFKKNLKNGYHFTDKFASNRKLAILNKCDKLMEKLSQSTYLEQDKEILNRLDGGPKSNIRIDYSSQSEEAAVTQVTLESKIESFLHEKKIMNYSSIPMTKELQSNYQPVQRVPSEVISARSSKFDKIVVLGNSSYQYYLEQLRGPKVCIMSDDISADVLLSYIKCKEPLMPSRTLWVLVTGIEFLFTNSVNMLCSSLRCNYPLQSTLPSVEVALYSNALTTIHEINNELNIIEQNVKRVLNFESDFMFFPPIPPAMIIDSTVAHQDLHRLMVKYPRCYIVTNIIASYFIDIFEKVSFSFAHFTRSALEDMGISADPIKKYFVCHLNQIDFISCGITLPPNKLPFFIEWSNTFRDIISSCAGDSCCFEVSSERESYIYSDDENDETDFESRAVLSEYEKKSLSKVKSDCRIVFEGSSKNKCQYEVIDLTEESDVKSVESAVECKSSTVKAADGTSSRIKGNTVVSKNAFDTCSKPFSKDTFEKSVKDPKPKLSVKNVKQPLCKSDIVKQKCSIYEIAADDRPLPFLDSLESDAEPETLAALYEPDPKSEQDMESEIFDNFEEFSESSKDEVIQSDISHLNNSVVLGKNLEFSSSILPLEEESSEEDMHKSSKIEKNSYTSCDDDKSDLGEDIQEQLLIEEELEAEIFGDEECSYDDDDGSDNEDKARDTLEDDIENSSERLYSPAAAEPDRENIPTSKHAYSSLSKEEKLHSNNSDIQIESFLNNVKEVALEINNVSKDKEDLESCESTSVLENDTKISVSETKSDNITKETLNITEGHISECNISSDSIPEDKDFARNDSSQALTHVTINNDLKMDESFRKSEDSEDKHEVKMDSFDYDLLNKESDIIFDLEKASDSQSSNERFGKSEEKNVSNNEQDIENKKSLQDSMPNKIESSAGVDIKSQSQNVSEIAFENLDTSNEVQKCNICTDIFDETVIRLGKLENFDSKIEVVQDLCDERKANEIEDVGVAGKTFEKEETSKDKTDISEGSKKITEESDEESKLKFVSGEETTEKSNKIKLKLGKSVDNSDQTVDFEMNEASRDSTEKEMSKLTIDQIEILNDPNVIKLVADDQKNNEGHFLRLVDRDEKLTVKESFKVDNDKFVDHVNHNDSVVKDGINKVIEDDVNADDEVEIHEDSLKKIAFENVVDDVVDNLEENVETNLNKTDIIKDASSNTTFDNEKSILKDKLENKADHLVDEHYDSPVMDGLTGCPFSIVKDFKNTDSPANCSEKEIEQYSNKTNVQNLSLKEISKNETLNVQEDLEENTDGHLTIFDVEENNTKKEVILQQNIDYCNIKNSQTQSISNETSEVNVQCDQAKNEAGTLSNYNNVNSNQKKKDVSINIEELCDFKIEKSAFKPSRIIETGSFLENHSLNENLNHKKHETSVGEDSSKSIISNNNNPKIIDFINLDDNLNSSVIQSNPMKKGSSLSKDPKHIHDSIPQQNLLDQEIDSTVRSESAKESLLEISCDNVYGNFEEKCEHPVSKVEDKNKIENKCDETLSNLGTTVHDVPMKKKKLIEYDVLEIRDKGKEETVNHAVSKTSAVYDIENSDTNESIVIKASNDPLNNYSDYSNMNFEAKSDNTVVNSFSEELNKSACDLQKNATTEFINPSTTSSNSLELHETTKITKDLENPSSSCESATNKDPFSDLQNSELTDSDSYNQTVTSVDKNISHSANPNTNKFSSTNSNLVKNSNKSSENEINKSVLYIFLSDSEVEKEDSINTNSEKGTKIENVIPRYDHIYIIGGFNPLFKIYKNLLNFTFINKSISDLNEDNVIDLLEEKGCIVANSLCIFICDIIDIMKKYVETKSITSKSQGHDFIVYELKDSSSDTAEDGKLFISNSITSFIRIVDRLRNKLPVVVMPLQPYMLTVQFNFAKNVSGADDSRLFIHGASYKWTHYRDHFVNDWMRILDTNDKDINKTYIESFVTKPPFVYPIRKSELKGIGIKKRKSEWTIKVNEIIFKLVKAEFKMKSKKSSDSIKKEEYTTAGCSKEKFGEGEKCEIKITNLSESIPNKFFEEMSKKVGKEAICKFKEGYVEITFDSHLKGHLYADYLNNLAIGDTILKTTFLDKDCNKGIPKLDETRRMNFRERVKPLFELWEFSASEIVKKNIRHTLSCESYKTIECEESECDEASCIFYHSEMDRRRNPYSVPYGSATCKFTSSDGSCGFGGECQFAHNDYEFMFHPSEIYFKLCDDNKTRKQCFSVNPLCARAHRDSPETFFTEFWNDSLLFGTPLAVEFLAGAISKFNQFSSANKDTRIFMMGASMPFLHNVRKAVNQICGIHSLNNDFVGERDLPFECEPLLFGTPSKFLRRIGHLVVLPFTLIIVSQVDVLLYIRKERKALINFFARCQMPFLPPYVQTLFVADEYDADMQAKIKYYFSKNVKVIRNPEHKVKFDPDVPCTPFALKALPKWLDAGSNPSQVYPFLSAEVAESIVKGNKKKFANMPCLRREKFYSSDSSEFSDSLDVDDRRSNRRRGRKRKTSSSQYRSTSPSHKRYSSRSNRRRSASRSSRNSVKRLRSRQSCSSKSVVEKIQERRSRSPPKKRTSVRDVKVQNIKLFQSRPPLPPPPPPPPRIPPGSTFPGKDKKEQTQPDLSMDRVVHRSILLESSIQIFNTTTLRKELGNDLYEEFEAAREEIVFKLEEEFHVYKTMPNLYDKFEECYEGFMQMYKIQYPNHSDEHKEELWKEFWKSKFDFVEKTELRNRMVNLIGRFKQKVQSVPPAPSRPIKFVIHPRFKPCKSEIKMSSASDVSTAACTLPSSNASSTNRISDAYSNPTPVLSSNAPMSTSQVSDYSNFFHVPTPPPNISSFKQRFSEQHLDNPVGGQMKIHQSPFPPPPPILSDHSSQGTYNNAYYSNETSGVQARFHPSSSLSSKGSSVGSSQRETPPVEKAHSPLPSIPVESLAARIMALAKGNPSPLDIKNKSLNEVSNMSPLPSSSFNTSSVTSGHMLSIDNWSKRNSPATSSVITPTRTKDINECKVSEGESSLQNFSMDKAIVDLEFIVSDIGALGSSIKYIINIAKENGVNSEKSLRTFVNDDNITLMELALMKIKGMEGKKELYSSVERSVNGLIKYAKEELVKKERKELALNFEGIAKATVGKDSSAILQMIRTAARYEGVELTKQQENESYMKVCSIHFKLTTN